MLFQMFKKNTAKTIHLLWQQAEGALPCSIWLQSHSGKGSDFCCPASNNVSFSKKHQPASNNQQQVIHKPISIGTATVNSCSCTYNWDVVFKSQHQLYRQMSN